MSTRSCTLENRFGDKDNSSPPTDSELLLAASEVLNEAALMTQYAQLSEDDLAEHPNAWLDSGVEDGEVEILDLYRGGRLEFVRYADGEMTEELFKASLTNVTVPQAVALWQALRDGRVEEVEAAFR